MVKPYKIIGDSANQYAVRRRTDGQLMGSVCRPHWHGAATGPLLYTFVTWTAYNAQSQKIGAHSYGTRAEAAAAVYAGWQAQR